MFASDMFDNQVVELAKWRSLGLSDDDLEWVLSKTAAEAYGIKPTERQVILQPELVIRESNGVA